MIIKRVEINQPPPTNICILLMFRNFVLWYFYLFLTVEVFLVAANLAVYHTALHG